MSFDSIYLGFFTFLEIELKAVFENVLVEDKQVEKELQKTSHRYINQLCQFEIFIQDEFTNRKRRNKIQHELEEANYNGTIQFKNHLMNHLFPKIIHLKSIKSDFLN